MTSARENAFTLVELLVVVSLVVIITGAVIPNFTGFTKNQKVKQAQEMVKSDLRTAQNRILTGVGVTTGNNLAYWGIKFTAGNSRYHLVSCTDSACATVLNDQTSESLSSDVQIKNSATVIFDIFGNAVTAEDSSQIVRVGNTSNSITKCIEINYVGLIKKAVCP